MKLNESLKVKRFEVTCYLEIQMQIWMACHGKDNFPPLTKNNKAGFKTRKKTENHFSNKISLNNVGTYAQWHSYYVF